MLVLSRKMNESICIGDDIQITILEVRGKRIRLGCSAPPHISIRRTENVPADGSETGPVVKRKLAMAR